MAATRTLGTRMPFNPNTFEAALALEATVYRHPMYLLYAVDGHEFFVQYEANGLVVKYSNPDSIFHGSTVCRVAVFPKTTRSLQMADIVVQAMRTFILERQPS